MTRGIIVSKGDASIASLDPRNITLNTKLSGGLKEMCLAQLTYGNYFNVNAA